MKLKGCRMRLGRFKLRAKKKKITMQVIKKWENMLRFVAGSSALNILQQNQRDIPVQVGAN